MKYKAVTTILLLVLSEALGIGAGEWFFRLFRRVVPPAALSGFNTQATHVAHLAYGAGLGLVLFVWFLLGMMFGSMGRSKPKPAA
jgi:hypothetical protein